MALLEIIKIPDPILRRNAQKVLKIDQDVKKLINDMVETMREAPGVGLAAPQVGISSRIIVVEYSEETEDEEGSKINKKPPRLYVLINPEIIKPSQEMVTGTEACLSVPGLVGSVDRHEQITVKGLNKAGQPVKIKASGWLARIFQHEIDHLDGVIFPDRATRVWQPREDEQQTDV